MTIQTDVRTNGRGYRNIPAFSSKSAEIFKLILREVKFSLLCYRHNIARNNDAVCTDSDLETVNKWRSLFVLIKPPYSINPYFAV